MTAEQPSQGVGGGGSEVPTCYRHPNRETYLRCSRCDRPICPDCMREAPVGQQCVDCAGAGSKQTRPRTAFGGVGMPRTTVVTWVFLGLNVAVFLAVQISPQLANVLFLSGQGVAYGQWYRLLTGAFVHIQWWHILVNMYALFIIGPHMERALGHWRYAVLYLVAALAGSGLSVAVGGLYTASVGASGAIFGLFGATVIVFRRLRLDTRWILSVIAINLVVTFLFHGIIDWRGHVGGLVAGTLLAVAYAYAPRAQRLLVHIGAAVALVVLSLALVFVGL
ncbi:MAG: rhomboid family intramembrane serine protease [Streptosporangiales bacterium]